MIATALLRGINYFVNNDSFGEPLVWLFLRGYQRRRRVARAQRLEGEHGPVRPDRIVRDDDGSVILLASREKPGWDEHATVRVEDDFYRITATERRNDGSYTVIAYKLEAQPESENFLGLVHTDARLP